MPARRSASGTLAALGTSALEVNRLVRAVADSAAVELTAHAGAEPSALGGWIAQGAYEPLADAVLVVREQGRDLGRAESRELVETLSARIGEALVLLGEPTPDLAAVRRALRLATEALPPRPPRPPRPA